MLYPTELRGLTIKLYNEMSLEHHSIILLALINQDSSHSPHRRQIYWLQWICAAWPNLIIDYKCR